MQTTVMNISVKAEELATQMHSHMMSSTFLAGLYL